MATQSLEQLGLGTVESRIAEASPYTDFWTGAYPQALDAMGLLTPEAENNMHHFGGYICYLTESLIRGNELHVPAGYQQYISPGVGRTWGVMTSSWSKGLGNLNPMNDAQGDLLRAAGLMLDRNYDGSTVVGGDGARLVPPTDPRSVYKAFGSLWHNNDSLEAPFASRQRPSQALMASAEAVHRAAYLADDGQCQENLLVKAQLLYERIVDVEPHSRHGIEASELAADIRFHLGMTSLRRAQKRGDSSARDQALMVLGSVISDQAQAFVHDRTPGAVPAMQASSGRMLERFVRLNVRDMIVSQIIRGGPTPAVGIRKSFRHEDVVPYGLHLDPQPSFDVVMQRTGPDGHMSSTPVQIKLKNGHGNDGIDKSPENYLPGIAELHVAGLSGAQMEMGALGLVTKYSGRQGDHRKVKFSKRIDELQEQLASQLLAA